MQRCSPSKQLINSSLMDEPFDLIHELEIVLCIMPIVMIIEAILVGFAMIGPRMHHPCQ